VAREVGVEVDRRWTLAANGFSARLTGRQAEQLAGRRDVLLVAPEGRRHLDTWSTPDALGLSGEDGAWLRHAAHANAMAQRLAAGLAAIPGVRLLFPVEANGVFAELPPPLIDGLRARGWRFYTFIGAGGARFMCAWDTRPESVDALLADLRQLAG
ncbi:MAG TPA: protease inhibitor I9 family protein, partial [Azospira sp.]|nr:protease inhibitor I9 family protein [Azospira sp.]